MPRWLLKTEPDCYSWDQFTKDKKTCWDGVTNALALKHIRSVKKGDLAFFYHTGDDKFIIGVGEVVSDPYPDPKEDNPKLAVFDIKIKKKLSRPVDLATIKSDPAFAQWDLVKNSRLSVMPVPDALWKRIEDLADASKD